MFRLIKGKLLGKKNLQSQSLYGDIHLKKSLDENITLLKKVFSDDDTIRYRQISSQGNNSLRFCLIFVNGMVNNEMVNKNIIKPLMKSSLKEKFSNNKDLEKILEDVMDINEIKISSDIY